MPTLSKFFTNKGNVKVVPNYWDGMALILVVGVLGLLAWGAKQMSVPYHIGQSIPISLNPKHLPEYALLTFLRMLIALFVSVIFTLIFGTWAAKSKRAEQIIIPIIDILQSVPVLAFLSITVTGFIALFPGSQLGPECAVIFLIFTAQAWNITLSFYQSLRTVPLELKEAADMFHLSAWQRFWRIEVPFAMPGLLWNMMLSMSGSWIFVVASESISVANQQITLPGIGSYLGLAISNANIHAVIYTIITVFIVIFIYDQLLFRPLIAWADKFRAEQTAQDKSARSWVTILLQRTRILRYLGYIFHRVSDFFLNYKIIKIKSTRSSVTFSPNTTKTFNILWYIFLFLLTLTSLLSLGYYVLTHVSGNELSHVFFLGCVTALRVLIVIIIGTLIWVPVGVWIGLRPKIAEIAQPIAQFFAAFPMNVLFPIVVIAILKFNLNTNIWITPLMLLGSQWYILFNVIAGAAAIPKDLKQVADNFGIKGWQWWKKLILPGIFPAYITGTITAIGNAWNTSVIAEVVSWGKTTLTATGLGAYITHYTSTGNFPRVALGMSVMSIFVLTLNHLIWRPLYNLSQARYRLE
jgi:NitT/TauT family transport system permease protein